MGKVIWDIPRGEIVRILSQLSLEEREGIMREVAKEHEVRKPKLYLLKKF